jgi:hypothetical protein
MLLHFCRFHVNCQFCRCHCNFLVKSAGMRFLFVYLLIYSHHFDVFYVERQP